MLIGLNSHCREYPAVLLRPSTAAIGNTQRWRAPGTASAFTLSILKWSRVLGFVQGLESTPDSPNLAIALVVQGLATDMLKAASPVAKGVSASISRGVELIAREYSMKVRKLVRGELNPGVASFVPFGGMEIVKRQAPSLAPSQQAAQWAGQGSRQRAPLPGSPANARPRVERVPSRVYR